MRGFVSKHLNVEIGLALRSDRWAGADFWEAQAERKLTLEALLARSEVVTVGIDGGGLDDLLGVAVLGREIETRRWLLWNRAYCSPIALERRKSEAARYRDLEASGDLVIVDGLPDDIDEAVGIVQTVRDAGILAGVGLDQIGLGGIVDALADIGVTQEAGQVFGIAQGWRQANAIKTLERKLADGTLVHAGQPLMAWCVGNAKVEPRGNAISITKQAAGAGKIDPLVASFNAAELMSKNPQAERSFWQLLEASGA
jgi:phage terminase large subunit-like protein